MLQNAVWAFPTVATIRKGEPKRRITNRQGKEVDSVGRDLKDRLRIAWKPGTTAAQQRWQATPGYGESLIVKEIRAMIPSAKVWDCLEIYNEAHQAGRMILRATDKQVITLREPTGKYLVRDGEPYTEYIPGQPVTYQNKDGKTITLPVKTSIRLRLFLYELGLPVQFELRSTSFYDAANLRQQFAGIQAMADMLNRGIAGGIPFTIYRQEQEVTWNKPDGSASRVPHWILNVMVSEDWLKAATQRMSQMALTGMNIAGLLQPVNNLQGAEDPNQGIDDPEEDEEVIIEGESRDADETVVSAAVSLGATVTTPPPPEEPPHPAEEAAQEGKAVTTPPTPATDARTPYPPIEVRDRLIDAARAWKEKGAQESPAMRQLVKVILKDSLDGLAIHNQERPDVAANTLLFWLTGFRDFYHINMEYIKAMKTWLKPTPADGSTDKGYVIHPAAETEIRACYVEATGLPADLI